MSVLSLPAVLGCGDPQQLLNTSLDALMRILAVDFLYARLTAPVEQGLIEAIRVDRLYGTKQGPDEINRVLNRWFGDGPNWPKHIRDHFSGDISVSVMRLGLQGELGAIVAGSERTNFPLETERLVLNVAANQVAMAIQQACLRSQQRFEGRAEERLRIAREFHDTLLQTIQGSKLVADSALKQSTDPVRMHAAIEQLSAWLGRATEEGRAALNSLRTSTTETNDLAEAFRRSIEDCRIQSVMQASFSVAGEVSEMQPIVRDEVFRIGYEAIRNACTHSQASRLQVELTYAEDLILRVRDNGIGIDPAIVGEGKEGHFGLQGMRERADRIMSKLTVDTSTQSGTEIRLVVPGGIIYRRQLSKPEVVENQIAL
ncbi:MAG TPA: ATP-binding protein [Acidobacteriaceae bacterium]|nr:ATP-binding protein [Acidobacteriaceae bacterium]